MCIRYGAKNANLKFPPTDLIEKTCVTWKKNKIKNIIDFKQCLSLIDLSRQKFHYFYIKKIHTQQSRIIILTATKLSQPRLVLIDERKFDTRNSHKINARLKQLLWTYYGSCFFKNLQFFSHSRQYFKISTYFVTLTIDVADNILFHWCHCQ